jgi:hypothetical protein
MKSITLALALASALFTFASKVEARPAEARGTVEVRGRAVKAVKTGPALIHGYSAFSGGALVVVPVVAGRDADCSAAVANHGGLSTTTLVADQMAYVQVGAGQTVCLVTNTPRSFELLWHAFATEGTQTTLASAKAR